MAQENLATILTLENAPEAIIADFYMFVAFVMTNLMPKHSIKNELIMATVNIISDLTLPLLFHLTSL